MNVKQTNIDGVPYIKTTDMEFEKGNLFYVEGNIYSFVKEEQEVLNFKSEHKIKQFFVLTEENMLALKEEGKKIYSTQIKNPNTNGELETLFFHCEEKLSKNQRIILLNGLYGLAIKILNVENKVEIESEILPLKVSKSVFPVKVQKKVVSFKDSWGEAYKEVVRLRTDEKIKAHL